MKRIVLLIKTILFYFKAYFSNIFKINTVSKFSTASQNLFLKSFRVSQLDSEKNLLPFIFIKQLIYKKISNEVYYDFEEKVKNGKYIYDGNKNSYLTRKAFCEFYLKDNINGAFYKNELCVFTTLSEKTIYLLIVVLFSPFIWIKAFFSKDKSPASLLIFEILECYQLLKLCEKNQVKELYHFHIYEKDSNINTLLLQKQNIKVVKIPSEVPLGMWNKKIIADELCICNAYQMEEVNYYKKTMFINEIKYWGPENILHVIKLYGKTKSNNLESDSIAFYSTASWVRKLKGHIDQGTNMVENEYLLKTFIREYCIIHPNIRLKIYLHPKEKHDDLINETYVHYKQIFKDIKYEISDPKQTTSELFNNENIAVAFNSTIIYERLFFGFKALLMPLAHNDFPIKGSTIENICVFDKNELFKKLDTSLKLSTHDFFKVNKLEKYPFNSIN